MGHRENDSKTAKDFEGETIMWLNLSTTWCNDYHEYTVLHDFGHVLGLGHEHQMSHLAEALGYNQLTC